MSLHLLPDRADSAAANMAADFLLLKRYPSLGDARFRHYDWHRPAFTFGYSQKIAEVRAKLPPDDIFELIRRPSGGGLVDHRNDWTYSLIIPRGHALYEARAAESYRAVHQALVDTLRALGRDVVLETDCPKETNGPGICFVRAEIHDVIQVGTRVKVAGAAQKRTKEGLLFQGSIARTSAGPIDWDLFATAFPSQLAATLNLESTDIPWPDFPEAELEALTEHYTTPEWNAFR